MTPVTTVFIYLEHFLVKAGEKRCSRLVKVDFPVEEEAFELIEIFLEQPSVSFVQDAVGLSKDPVELPLRVGEQIHHET